MIVRTKLLLPLSALALAFALAAPAFADDMGKSMDKGIGKDSGQGGMSRGSDPKTSSPMNKGNMSQTPGSGMGGSMNKGKMGDQK